MGAFSYLATKGGRVRISWQGKPVVTLSGREARGFIANVAGLDEAQTQLLLARVTGNFKRGNEKIPKRP